MTYRGWYAIKQNFNDLFLSTLYMQFLIGSNVYIVYLN